MANQHPDLLAAARRQFCLLTAPGSEQVEVYRTKKKAFGVIRTVVVTFNPKLLQGQLQGIEANLAKAQIHLPELQVQLRRRDGDLKKGKAPTLDSVQRQIRSICFPQWVSKILQAEVHSTPQGRELTFHRDSEALEQLSRVQPGKTILFTDNQDWTDEQIVLAYRSQYHIEDAFRR